MAVIRRGSVSERVRLFIGRDGMFPPAILPVPRLRGSVRYNRQHTNVEGIVVPYVTTGSTLMPALMWKGSIELTQRND